MMAAPDDLLYEYSVVRYVPCIEREEFINIGLLMLCKRRKWLRGKIELNETRVRAFDSKVDIEDLRNQSSMFVRTDLPAPDLAAEEKYRWLAAAKSAVLQVGPSHPGLIAASNGKEESVDPNQILDNEFHRLFDILVR